MLGTIIALIGALGAGIVALCIKYLVSQTHYLVPTLSFAFFNMLLGPLATLLKLVFINDSLVQMGLYETAMLLLIGLLLYLVLVFNTWAFKYEKAGRVAPIQYLQIIVNCVVDLVIFKTELTWNQVLGGLIIICSNLSISLLKCLNLIK